MSRLLRFVGIETEDSFGYTCCTNKVLGEEDQQLYDSGKKLVSSALRLMARGKEEIISPANETSARLKLREKYDSIHKILDENDNEDEVSIELSNLQRIESGMNRSSNSPPPKSFFSALSSYSQYEKLEKSNINPVLASSNSKDFSFEDDDDENRFTGRYR